MSSVGTEELSTLLTHAWHMARLRRYCPLLVWGEAGVGKSETVRKAADKLGIDFVDLRLANLEAPDLMGLMRDEHVYPCLFCLQDPDARKDPLSTGERYSKTGLWHHAKVSHSGQVSPAMASDPTAFTEWMIAQVEAAGYGIYVEFRTVYSAPMWFPEPNTSGILFLDELNRSQRDTRQGVFQLLLDRRIHELELPPNWLIVSANNPGKGSNLTSSSYDGDEITDRALLSRFCHLVLEPSSSEWLDYARSTGVDPGIRSLIANDPSGALLGLKTGLSIPSIEPTPRSWVLLSQMLAPVRIGTEPERRLSGSLVDVVTQGILGRSVGQEFSTFLSEYDQVDGHWEGAARARLKSDQGHLFEVRLEEIGDALSAPGDAGAVSDAVIAIDQLLGQQMVDVATRYLSIWSTSPFPAALASARLDPGLSRTVSWIRQHYGVAP